MNSASQVSRAKRSELWRLDFDEPETISENSEIRMIRNKYPQISDSAMVALRKCLLKIAYLPFVIIMDNADFNSAMIALTTKHGTDKDLELTSPFQFGAYSFEGHPYFLSKTGKYNLFFGFGTVESVDKSLVKLSRTNVVWLNEKIYPLNINLFCFDNVAISVTEF